MVKASRKQVLLNRIQRKEGDEGLPDLESVEARRMLGDDYGEWEEAPRSQFVEVLGSDRPAPDWLITEQYEDEILGPVKGGKEGEVYLVARSSPDRTNLLALKRYKDPNMRAFRRDQIYREGVRLTRDTRRRRAAWLGTDYGRVVLADQWSEAEFNTLARLWEAGADVPYPVSPWGGLLMQFIGNIERAAPRLVDARLGRDEARVAYEGILRNVRLFASAGMVHADLSAFNVLWWEGTPFIIDFPQAVDIYHNPHAVDFLRRDITNIARWFGRFGIDQDPDVVLSEVLAEAF